MSMTDPAVPLEALLRHDAGLRSLARSLVADPAAADDLVQETWMRAHRRGPEDPLAAATWLRTILRRVFLDNLRKSGRRAHHERHSPVFDQVPSAAELAERESVRRELADAVLALDEPYRSTLLLRYYRGLDPGAIAERDAVPLETVRTRLKRGHALLRDRFDRRKDGSDWRARLLPLASEARVASSTSVAIWVAAFIAGALAILGVVRLLSNDNRPADIETSRLEESPQDSRTARRNEEPAILQESAQDAGAPPISRIVSTDIVDDVYPFAEPVDEKKGWQVIATRMVSPMGEPIAGARIQVIHESKFPERGRREVLAEAVSDERGWVRIPLHGVTERIDGFLAMADGLAPSGDFSGHPHAAWVLERGLDTPIVLLDRADRPVAGADVELILGCGHTPDVRHVVTDAAGRAVVPDALPDEGDLWCLGDGILAEGHSLETWRPGEPPLVIRAAIGRTHIGRLLDENRLPIVGAIVGSTQFHRGPWVRTDDEGRFRLRGAGPREELEVHIAGREPAIAVLLVHGSEPFEVSIARQLEPGDIREYAVGDVPEKTSLPPFARPDDERTNRLSLDVIDEPVGPTRSATMRRILRWSWNGLSFSQSADRGRDPTDAASFAPPLPPLIRRPLLIRTPEGAVVAASYALVPTGVRLSIDDVIEDHSSDGRVDPILEFPLPGVVALHVVPKDRDWLPSRLLVEADAMTDGTPVSITLRRRATHALRILDENDRPFAGAEVTFGSTPSRRAKSDAQGYVAPRFDVAPDGLRVRVAADDRFPMTATIDAEHRTLRFAKTRIDVVAADPDGRPLDDAVAFVDDEPFDLEGGRGTLRSLPPGRHTLIVAASGWPTKRVVFDLVDRLEIVVR